MGDIVFWAIIRAAIVIPSLWILKGYIDYQLWWYIVLLGIYGVIVHPAIIHYRLFEEKNKEIFESTLCSSCKHFDKSSVLCTKHDEHPTKDFLPCEGNDWEPNSKEFNTDQDQKGSN